MKVEVTRPFKDKFNLAREFTPGEVLDFEPARAEDIVSRGLGKFHAEKAETPVPEPEKVVEPEKAAEPEKVEPEVESEVSEPEKAEETNDEPEKVSYVEKKRPGRKRKTE